MAILGRSLRAVIDSILNQRKKIVSVWLFHTNRGQPYIKEDSKTSGFKSIWQRFMKKALEKTDLIERFTEHDLRAKVASDTESEHARQLLGHTSIEITNKVYRRKAEIIKPVK